MKKNNLKKINSQKIKKILGNIFSSIGSKFKKIKPVEFGVGAVVIVLSCVVIVPSLVQCVINRNKAKCSTHMSIMLNMLSDELTDEMKTGETYWHDLIQNGNYQKLISSLNEKTGLSKKYPSTNYYIRTGEEKLALMCKKHKDISDKEIKFALMKDVSVEVAEKPQIGEKIAYLTVSGPDTYYEDDMLDENNPTKMVFIGREVDKVIKNLTVTAVYAGGAREELPRSKYTVTADKLNMKKSGQTHLTVKSNSSSLWDNSAYAQFVIDVVGDDDIAPLIVDSGTNGRFELASWEWNDFVTEAAQEDGKKSFGASIIRYNGNYYYTGSDLYGWNSSRVYVMQSDSILGDYNKDTGLPYIMNNTRDSFAHNSQAGFYTTIHGSENDLIIYCGDRWGDFAGNGIGYNQWVPLSFDKEGKPYFNNLHQWKLDAEKGTWEVGKGNNYISNPEFEADRKITATPTGWKVHDNVGNYSVSNARGKVDSGNFVIQETAPEDYISDLYQEITDLPNGTYTMTAWVKSSGGQNVCNVYAQSGDEKKTYSVKTNIDDWKEIVVATDIKVTDGKCTVGLYSDAHANEWVQMDNVRLVKNKVSFVAPQDDSNVS